jgi:hypothetical protein
LPQRTADGRIVTESIIAKRLSGIPHAWVREEQRFGDPRFIAKYYSPVSNIGDIRSLEEGSDEGSIVLDIDEVGLDAFLQQFI